MPPMAEQKSPNEVLTSNKKEWHVRDSPKLSQRPAETARSDVQVASASYRIEGGIESECFALPPFPSPRTPVHTISPATDRDTPSGASVSDYTPSSFTSSSHDIPTANRGHANKRPSPAVLESDFTFRAMTSMYSRTQPTPPPGTPPSFKSPETILIPVRCPMKLGSTRDVEPARSIFKVLHDRSKLATSSISSEVAMSSIATALVASVEDDLQQDLTRERTTHAANLQGGAKARVGIEGLHLAEAELNKCQETHETVTADSSQSVAPVLRFQVFSVPSKPEVIPLPNLLRVSEPTETWHSSRIFFATGDGHTRLVDFEQTMYDIDVAEDDGGSDFDSIASPAKYSPAKFDPRLSLLCDDPEATSSSDDIETEFDVEDLAELRRFDCTFIAFDSETIGGIVMPATTNSLSEEEDVIDFCFRVPTLEAAQKATDDTPTSVVVVGMLDPKKDSSISPTNSEIDLSCENVTEISVENVSVASSPYSLVAVMIPDVLHDFQSSCMSDAMSDQACDFNKATINAELVPQVDVAHDPLSAHVLTESTASVGEAENSTASILFPSDWASELARLTLGTE
jgi:hypothetical protein